MHRSSSLKLLALASIIFTVLSLCAQNVQNIPIENSETDNAKSVSISGDWALVGYPTNSNNNPANYGHAYFYHRNSDNQWVQVKTVRCPDSDLIGEARFGNSVAISGNWAMIGAPGVIWSYYNSLFGSAEEISGKVYVYHYNGEDWEREDLPANNFIHGNARFGTNITINGNYAAISAPNQSVTDGNGRTFVYEYNSDIDSWEYSDRLDCPGITQGYGQPVAIAYPHCLVGIPNLGKVLWKNLSTGVLTNIEDGSNFGLYVAIDGNSFLIGSSSMVHMYQFNNNSYTEISILNDPTNVSPSYVIGISIKGIYSIISYSPTFSSTNPNSKISIFKSTGYGSYEISRIHSLLDTPDIICGHVFSSDSRIIVGGMTQVHIADYKFQNVKISLTSDQGLIDVENSTIKFTNLDNDSLYIYHPELNGILNTPFFHNRNGRYDIEITKAGYYPYVINNVVINADNNDLAYPVNLYPIGDNVNVSHILPNAFQTIQAALDYAIANEKSLIYIYPGTYIENIDLSGLPSTIVNFTIRGPFDGATIHGKITANPINSINQLIFDNLIMECWVYSGIANISFTGNIASVSFTDCIFRNYDKSAALTATVPIKLTSCEFYNNLGRAIKVSNTSAIIEDCWFHNNAGTFGGAIYAEATSPISVTGCTFENNSSSTTGNDPGETLTGTSGGAVYFKNSSNILIDNNLFTSNTTSGSGGPVDISMIPTNSPVSFTVTNNKFVNNFGQGIGEIYHGAIGLSFEGCAFSTQSLISHNFITHGGCSNDFILVRPGCSGELRVNNCDFIMDTMETANEGGAIIRTYSTLTTRFVNCLFKTGENDAFFAASTISGPNTMINNSVSYSLFEQGYHVINGGPENPFLTTNNTTDVSDMYLDNNYVPKWDAVNKSPCIDQGFPLQLDPDGTPSDIGCYRGPDHAAERYRFEDMEELTKYYWLCFPVLDNVTNGENLASEFFKDLMGTELDPSSGYQVPELLRSITWMEGGLPNYIVWIPGDEFSDGSWNVNAATHFVTSERGYKFRLEPGRVRTFKVNGFLADPQTSFHLTANVENWIGYTLKDSSMPQDALVAIWDDLLMIKTKDWCMTRFNSDCWLSAGRIYPFNYGDMVVLLTQNDHDIYWGTPDMTEPDKMPEPKHFVFPEKQDYVPIYIDLKDVDRSSLAEIGLNMNSVCKGAVVVTDSLVMISAFLEGDEIITAENSEFVFYYESKSQPQEMKTVKLTDSMFKKSFIDGNTAYPYYQVSIKGSDLTVPVVTATTLSQNYPNPFNPTTTISYSLKEDAKVALDIYNIRGQLVKSLESGFVQKGMHSVVWEGKDNAGNVCASGVYFYRLSTNQSTLTKKMLLLK